MSRLTKIEPLYRGWTGATLPRSFFEPDALGLCGGVEYGFSSTTTVREQAVHSPQASQPRRKKRAGGDSGRYHTLRRISRHILSVAAHLRLSIFVSGSTLASAAVPFAPMSLP